MWLQRVTVPWLAKITGKHLDGAMTDIDQAVSQRLRDLNSQDHWEQWLPRARTR